MLAQEIIAKKRDGKPLSEKELAFFVGGITDGQISEGQVAAFAMAVYFQKLQPAERVALTQAMTKSGQVLNWQQVSNGRPVLDKHSTGGVGDKVSLMLAPILAACGALVPMISGRGLGHTGGTLDKLDSIPGYDSTPDLDQFKQVVAETGFAIIGQTTELAPADRRFYAIRDITATVESLDLITASILSKKLAAGLDALILDVKFGSGAFMLDEQDARSLAQSLVTVANGAGLRCQALLTDMSQLLGFTAGNAIEVLEAIDYLTGKAREPRLDEVVRRLAAQALLLSDLAADQQSAAAKVAAVLDNGRAAECWQKMVTALGGPADLLEKPADHLPLAEQRVPVKADRSGFVGHIDLRAIGWNLVALGGGRRRAEDAINPGIGLSHCAALGSQITDGGTLAMLHGDDATALHEAAKAIRQAIIIEDSQPHSRPLIKDVIDV